MDNLDSNRFELGMLLMPSYEYRAFFSPRLHTHSGSTRVRICSSLERTCPRLPRAGR